MAIPDESTVKLAYKDLVRPAKHSLCRQVVLNNMIVADLVKQFLDLSRVVSIDRWSYTGGL